MQAEPRVIFNGSTHRLGGLAGRLPEEITQPKMQEPTQTSLFSFLVSFTSEAHHPVLCSALPNSHGSRKWGISLRMRVIAGRYLHRGVPSFYSSPREAARRSD